MIEQDDFDAGWSVTLNVKDSPVFDGDEVRTDRLHFKLGYNILVPEAPASIDLGDRGGDIALDEMVIFLATALGKFMRLLPRRQALRVLAKVGAMCMTGRGEKRG